MIIGFSVLSISANVRFTTSICSSKVGCEISTICTSKSASRTSSKVDLKDSTNSVGNLRINPTVSDSKNGKFSIMTLRTVVSNVANNLFSAKTSLLLNKFIKVDLPTFVYPTNATRTILPRFFRCTLFCLSISTSSFFNRAILSKIIRLSVSNCVSPGPRIPTPPR